MIATENGQSVADFTRNAAETLDRIGRTGEPEVLTVDGEVRAVLVSPAVYRRMADEVQLTRDVNVMRQSMREIDEGKGMEAGAFFAGLRAKLTQSKRERDEAAGE